MDASGRHRRQGRQPSARSVGQQEDWTPLLVQHDTDLWSKEYHLAWLGGLVPIPVRMTVIRLANGQLILHSPAPGQRHVEAFRAESLDLSARGL